MTYINNTTEFPPTTSINSFADALAEIVRLRRDHNLPETTCPTSLVEALAYMYRTNKQIAKG